MPRRHKRGLPHTKKRRRLVRLKKNRAISVFLYFRLFLNVLEEGFSPPLLGLCLNGRMAGLQKSLREIPAIGYFPWEGVKRRGNRRGSEKRGAGRLIPTAGRPRCFHPSHCGVFLPDRVAVVVPRQGRASAVDTSDQSPLPRGSHYGTCLQHLPQKTLAVLPPLPALGWRETRRSFPSFSFSLPLRR